MAPITKRWKENAWPMGIIIGLTVFVATTLAIVTVCIEHGPQLVSDHYYAEGYNLKQVLAAREQTNATGWNVAVTYPPPSRTESPMLLLDVLDAAGLACDSLVGDVAVYRPSNQMLDLPTAQLRSIGGGKYYVKLPRPLERGAWQAVVGLSNARGAYRNRISFFVEG